MAQQNGFGESDVGRVALVTTELATNLIKHGGGGEIIIGAFQDAGGGGVEVLALDRGRGMSNVDACLADGYSSAGTRGNGLGAVVRKSHFVDIASWPVSAPPCWRGSSPAGRSPSAARHKTPGALCRSPCRVNRVRQFLGGRR